MKVNFKNALPLKHVEVERPDVRLPYFLSLKPIGEGTGNVEALSSYLCRQAESLMEWTPPFSERLLHLYLDKSTLPKCRKIPIIGLHATNGIGVMADRHIEAIAAASGRINAEFLTMKPLQYLSDSRGKGLMKRNLAWCDECWRQDVETEVTPYTRLYWLVQNVKVCAIHNRRLSNHCPCCGDVNHVFPNFPRQWICDKCGTELYKTDSDSAPESFTSAEAWSSFSIYRLIERTQNDKLNLREHMVRRALNHILETSRMSAKEFSLRLNIDKKIVDRLLEGKRRPYFPVLLDLCYRLNIPIDQFLLDRDILTAKDYWRDLVKPAFVVSSKISDKKKIEVARALKKVLAEDPNPPIRINHFARQNGVGYDVILYHFPKEYNELRSRWTTWERKQRKSNSTDRLQNLSDAVFSLVRVGIYPSDRKMRDLELVKPSDFRRDDVIYLLRSFQEIYRDLQTDP